MGQSINLALNFTTKLGALGEHAFKITVMN